MLMADMCVFIKVGRIAIGGVMALLFTAVCWQSVRAYELDLLLFFT